MLFFDGFIIKIGYTYYYRAYYYNLLFVYIIVCCIICCSYILSCCFFDGIIIKIGCIIITCIILLLNVYNKILLLYVVLPLPFPKKKTSPSIKFDFHRSIQTVEALPLLFLSLSFFNFILRDLYYYPLPL